MSRRPLTEQQPPPPPGASLAKQWGHHVTKTHVAAISEMMSYRSTTSRTICGSGSRNGSKKMLQQQQQQSLLQYRLNKSLTEPQQSSSSRQRIVLTVKQPHHLSAAAGSSSTAVYQSPESVAARRRQQQEGGTASGGIQRSSSADSRRSSGASSSGAASRARSEPRSIARDALEKGNSGVSLRYSSPRLSNMSRSVPYATGTYDTTGMADLLNRRTGSLANSGSAMLSQTERFRSPTSAGRATSPSLGPERPLGMAVEQQRSPRNSGVGMHMTEARFSSPSHRGLSSGPTVAASLNLRPFRTVTRPSALWLKEDASERRQQHAEDDARRQANLLLKLQLVREALTHFTSTKSLREMEEALQQLTYDRIARGLIISFLRKHFDVGVRPSSSDTREVSNAHGRGGAPVSAGSAPLSRGVSPSRSSRGGGGGGGDVTTCQQQTLIDKRTGKVLNPTSGSKAANISTTASSLLLRQFPKQLAPFQLPRAGSVPKCVTTFLDYVFEESLTYTLAPKITTLTLELEEGGGRYGASAGPPGEHHHLQHLDGAGKFTAASPSIEYWLSQQYGLSAAHVQYVWPTIVQAAARASPPS